MNTLWLILIILSIISSLMNGNVNEVNEIFSLIGKDTLEITFPLVAMATFFNGWLAIAERLDIINNLSKFLKPILSFVFPDLRSEDKALGYIASNLLMNAFGLGSAATTSGLKAMKELDELNHHSENASRSMITFIVLNSAGITLFSTTVAALRIEYGSINPFNHLPYALLASSITFFIVIVLDKLISRR